MAEHWKNPQPDAAHELPGDADDLRSIAEEGDDEFDDESDDEDLDDEDDEESTTL